MSSERAGSRAAAAGIGVAVLVCAAGLWTAYQGAAFAWYALDVEPARQVSSTADPAAASDRLATMLGWKNVPGLGDRVRMDQITAVRSPASSDSGPALAGISALVAIDPANSRGWLDLARLAHQDGAKASLAEAAFTLSVLSAPWEATQMRQRVGFIVEEWDSASPEEQRRGIQDMANLLREQPGTFRAELASTLAAIPAERRDAIVAAVRERNPGFTP